MQRNEKSRDELSSFNKNELQTKRSKRCNFFLSKRMESDNRHDRQQNVSYRKEGVFSQFHNTRCGNEHYQNVLSSPRKNCYDERRHNHPSPQRTSRCMEHLRDNFSLPNRKHKYAAPTRKIQLTDTMSPYRRVAKYDQTYSSLRKVHGIDLFPLDQSHFEKYIQNDVAHKKNNLSNYAHDNRGQAAKRRMPEEQSPRKNQRSEKYNRNDLSPLQGNQQKFFSSPFQRNRQKNAFLHQNNRIPSRKNRHPVINSSPCQYHNVGSYRQNSKSPFTNKWVNNPRENLSPFKNRRCNELPRNQSSSDKYLENKEPAFLEDRCSDRYPRDERPLCRKDRRTDPYPSNDISLRMIHSFDRYSERSSSSVQFIQNHKFLLHRNLSVRKSSTPPNHENRRIDNCQENHVFKKERHLNFYSEDDSFPLQRHPHVHKYAQNELSSRQITNRPKWYERTISPKRNDRKRSIGRTFKCSSDDLRQKIKYKGKRDREIKYDKIKERIQVEVLPTEQFQRTNAVNVKENKGHSKKQVQLEELSPLVRQIRFIRNKVGDCCTSRRDVSDRQGWKTENSSRNKSSFKSNRLGKPLEDEPFSGNNRRKEKFVQENSSPQRARSSRFKRRYENLTLCKSRSPLSESKYENQSRSRKRGRTKDVSPPQHKKFCGTILKNSSSRHSVHKPFRGVEQTEQIREKLNEMSKPAPKYVNDVDPFNKLLKDQDMENPMLEHIQKRKMMKEAKIGKDMERTCTGYKTKHNASRH